MTWKDKEIEKFNVEPYPDKPGWVRLRTPLWDYGMSITDFKKVRAKLNDFKIE